jgi:hypothetical protein
VIRDGEGAERPRDLASPFSFALVRLVRSIFDIYDDGILGKQWVRVFRNAGLERSECVF